MPFAFVAPFGCLKTGFGASTAAAGRVAPRGALCGCGDGAAETLRGSGCDAGDGFGVVVGFELESLESSLVESLFDVDVLVGAGSGAISWSAAAAFAIGST